MHYADQLVVSPDAGALSLSNTIKSTSTYLTTIHFSSFFFFIRFVESSSFRVYDIFTLSITTTFRLLSSTRGRLGLPPTEKKISNRLEPEEDVFFRGKKGVVFWDDIFRGVERGKEE